MNTDDFKREWTAAGDTLIAFTPESLQSVELPETSSDFLINAGLPDSAAPFLGFDDHGTYRLQPASVVFPIGSEFARYLCIGTNDSGDPICIDTKSNGEVVVLFHDDNFRPIYVNSAVEQLASSLLAFRKLVETTCELKGEDAFLDNDIPDQSIAEFEQVLRSSDPSALEENTFWGDQIEQLREGPYE